MSYIVIVTYHILFVHVNIYTFLSPDSKLLGMIRLKEEHESEVNDIEENDIEEHQMEEFEAEEDVNGGEGEAYPGRGNEYVVLPKNEQVFEIVLKNGPYSGRIYMIQVESTCTCGHCRGHDIKIEYTICYITFIQHIKCWVIRTINITQRTS